MTAESFHTYWRNHSALMCIGNGREWKGMEGSGEKRLYSRRSQAQSERNARDPIGLVP